MTGRSHEEAAQRYAAAGWPVFPLIPGEKIPLAHTSGFQDATTDPDQISRWWGRNPDRNIGIATGEPGPDVLDVDRHGKDSGFPSFNQLKREGLVPQPMALIRTPNGGMHAYYRGTAQRSGKLPDHHIDYRGRGGYVVAPPSVIWTRDGGMRPYEVVSHQRSAATFDWAAARQFLQPQAQPQRQPAGAAARPGKVEHLPEWVAQQKEGNRNDALFWAANRAIERGAGSGVLDSLARAARAAGLDEREITRTIRSAQHTAGQGTGFRDPEEGRRPVISLRSPGRPAREIGPEAHARQREPDREAGSL